MKIHNGELIIVESNQNDLFDFEVIDGSVIIDSKININLPGLRQINGDLMIFDIANVILNNLEIINGNIRLYSNIRPKLSYEYIHLNVIKLKLVKRITLYPNTTILINNKIHKNKFTIKKTPKDIPLMDGKIITIEDFKTFNEKYFSLKQTT